MENSKTETVFCSINIRMIHVQCERHFLNAMEQIPAFTSNNIKW